MLNRSGTAMYKWLRNVPWTFCNPLIAWYDLTPLKGFSGALLPPDEYVGHVIPIIPPLSLVQGWANLLYWIFNADGFQLWNDIHNHDVTFDWNLIRGNWNVNNNENNYLYSAFFVVT